MVDSTSLASPAGLNFRLRTRSTRLASPNVVKKIVLLANLSAVQKTPRHDRISDVAIRSNRVSDCSDYNLRNK